MRRVVIVLADGLRPDVVTPDGMPSLHALGRDFVTATRATTVRPSATVAALTSLATGLAPETHGLRRASLGAVRRLRGLPAFPASWAGVACRARSSRATSTRGRGRSRPASRPPPGSAA